MICSESEQTYFTKCGPSRVNQHHCNGEKDKNKHKDEYKEDEEKESKFRFGWQLSNNEIVLNENNAYGLFDRYRYQSKIQCNGKGKFSLMICGLP